MLSNDPRMCLASMPRSNSRFDLPRTEIGGDRAKPAEGSADRPLARQARGVATRVDDPASFAAPAAAMTCWIDSISDCSYFVLLLVFTSGDGRLRSGQG